MAHCLDNTFRVRVKCVPCTTDDGSDCCQGVPRQLCMTLSNPAFSSPACDLSTMDGKRVILNFQDTGAIPAVPNIFPNPKCFGGTGSGNLSFDQLWYGTFVIPCPGDPYKFMAWQVILACCGDGTYSVLMTWDTTNSSSGSPCCPLAFHELGCGFSVWPACAEVTCSPFSLSGTLSDSGPGTETVDYSIGEVPAEGCGGSIDPPSGDCCNSELDSHPNLLVEWAGPFDPGSYTALYIGPCTPYSGGAPVDKCWSFTGGNVDSGCPGGGELNVYYLTCKEYGTVNEWVLRGGTAGISLPCVVCRGFAACNPFSVVFSCDFGTGPNTISVSL